MAVDARSVQTPEPGGAARARPLQLPTLELLALLLVAAVLLRPALGELSPDPAVVEAETIRPIPQPAQPYE